jgi:hypothetical protein
MENKRSEWFLALQGLHQGAPCSMLMHQVYENDMIKEFKNCISGSVIENITVTSPAYADDISLVALSKKGLQRLFNIAYNFSVKWRFEFNISKCAIVIYGKDQYPSLSVTLGDIPVKVSDSEPHLGIILSGDAKCITEYINCRVHTCKQMTYASLGIGSARVPLNPIIGSKLYWQATVPKLTYGFEILQTKKILCELVGGQSL